MGEIYKRYTIGTIPCFFKKTLSKKLEQLNSVSLYLCNNFGSLFIHNLIVSRFLLLRCYNEHLIFTLVILHKVNLKNTFLADE